MTVTSTVYGTALHLALQTQKQARHAWNGPLCLVAHAHAHRHRRSDHLDEADLVAPSLHGRNTTRHRKDGPVTSMRNLATMSVPSTQRSIVKDEIYYWDTVRFIIDGTLFKVPRYQFVVGSEHFAKTYLQRPTPAPILNADADDDDDGWDSMDVTDAPRPRPSVASAIPLEGVSADEFRVFLKLLFPMHSTTTTLELTKAEWLTVLKLSTRWRFLELRKLAISRLDEQMTDPVEMITVGRREYVYKWVQSGFEGLVRKDGAISEEESEAIGWKTAVKLYIVRHERERTSESEKTTRAMVWKKFIGELRTLNEEARSRRTEQEVQEERERASEFIKRFWAHPPKQTGVEPQERAKAVPGNPGRKSEEVASKNTMEAEKRAVHVPQSVAGEGRSAPGFSTPRNFKDSCMGATRKPDETHFRSGGVRVSSTSGRRSDNR